MSHAEDRLGSYLLEGESVQEGTSGRILDDDVRGRATVGLTDRRVLCLSETGEFVDVRYDYVCSIRSRRRTRIRYRPRDGTNRTLFLLGSVLAVGALVAGGFATSSATLVQGVATVVLAAVTVVVAVAVDRVRKRPRVERTGDSVLVGAGVTTLLIALVIALVAASVIVPVFVLATVGGLGVARYVSRYRDDLGDVGLERHTETLLSIGTVDGETVHVAIDAPSDLDRTLSTAVHRTDPAPVDVPVVRPQSDRVR